MGKREDCDGKDLKPRWGAEKRLQFIEFTAYWEGSVNRKDIRRMFSVSVPQASTDLADYQKIAPNNLRYDASAKCYIAAEDFVPVLIRPLADQYLAQLSAWTSDSATHAQLWLSAPPEAVALPIPQRPVEPQILRTFLAAIRAMQSVEVEYHSMNIDSPEQKWRRITPHAFAFDGFRWHVRAWCHRSKRFKDFLLSRCCGARKLEPTSVLTADDAAWSKFVEVTLTPNSALTTSQRRAVELDYGMKHGRVSVSVRLAMLYYFDKHVNPGLTQKTLSNEEARQQPIVVENLRAYVAALKLIGVKRHA